MIDSNRNLSNMKFKPVAENRFAKARPWDGRNRKNLPGNCLVLRKPN